MNPSKFALQHVACATQHYGEGEGAAHITQAAAQLRAAHRGDADWKAQGRMLQKCIHPIRFIYCQSKNLPAIG